MILRASGLAVLAALSPTALLIAAVYLGSASPRRTAGFYLLGAAVMSLVMAVVLLVLLRTGHLSRPAEHAARYDVRLVFGLLLVGAGLVVATRRQRAADGPGAGQGFVARMAASPQPLSAFLVGILVFAPGATFLAAVQVIATARAGVELTILAVTVVVVINVVLVWGPIVFHLVAPDRTTRYLSEFNGWLRAHMRALQAGVLLVVGAILVGNGIYGLV